MPTEPPADPVKTLWQTQSKEAEVMKHEDIVSKARGFQAKVRRRNLINNTLAVLGMVTFAIYVYVFPGWMIKIGSLLCILAAVNFVWQQHVRTAAGRIPDAPAAALADFYRAELVRDRDAVGGSWLWEIAPTLPGLALITLGRWFQDHASDVPVEFDRQVIVLGTIIAVLTIVIAVLFNRIHVYRLQRQIDELDRSRGAGT
jgi:uncharacterized membrane protein (DUF485 family)